MTGVVVLGELLRLDSGETLGSRLRRKALALSGLLVPFAALAAVLLIVFRRTGDAAWADVTVSAV